MEYRCKILMSTYVTHDVKRFIVERPVGFEFTPGQGVELAIDNPEWRAQGRPFTPTSLPGDQVLEFIIKAYPEHQGVTQALHQLDAGQALLMSVPFGTIQYHGPGVFIAGGAGITPFLSILRMLDKQQQLNGNHLIFANKTTEDIICERELRHLLGGRATFICSQQGDDRCVPGRVDKAYLQQAIHDYSQHFYLCGPPPFVKAISASLVELGATPDAVLFER